MMHLILIDEYETIRMSSTKIAEDFELQKNFYQYCSGKEYQIGTLPVHSVALIVDGLVGLLIDWSSVILHI
jgi:hypothetical protein